MIEPGIRAGLDSDEAVRAVFIGQGASCAGEIRGRAVRGAGLLYARNAQPRSPAKFPPAYAVLGGRCCPAHGQ